MKIMMFNHERELNGASLSLLGIVDCLSSKHEFWVVTSFGDGPFYNEISKRNIHVVVVPFRRWMRCRSSNIKGKYRWIKDQIKWMLYEDKGNSKCVRELKKIIESNEIDVLYTNTRVIDMGMRCAEETKIPHILHIREFGEEDFSMYPLMSYRKHFSYIKKNTSYVIYNSRAVKDKFQRYNLGDNRQKVIYNGLPLSKREIIHNIDKTVFLISGRISETKGQKEVLRAVKYLLSLEIDNFEVWMAGKEDKTYTDFYQEYDNVGQKVKLLGQRSDMDVLREASDVELVCSRMEAFGRVTVEAMMAGNPVIGSNTGGTVELIEEGFNGFLYEKGNAVRLAEKMILFIKKKVDIFEMGANARTYAEKKYSIEKCAGEVDSVFELFDRMRVDK